MWLVSNTQVVERVVTVRRVEMCIALLWSSIIRPKSRSRRDLTCLRRLPNQFRSAQETLPFPFIRGGDISPSQQRSVLNHTKVLDHNTDINSTSLKHPSSTAIDVIVRTDSLTNYSHNLPPVPRNLHYILRHGSYTSSPGFKDQCPFSTTHSPYISK